MIVKIFKWIARKSFRMLLLKKVISNLKSNKRLLIIKKEAEEFLELKAKEYNYFLLFLRKN
jgi:hypothetical protein